MIFANASPVTISQAVANLITAITPALVVILGAAGTYFAWWVSQKLKSISTELRGNTALSAQAAISAAAGDAGQMRRVNEAIRDVEHEPGGDGRRHMMWAQVFFGGYSIAQVGIAVILLLLVIGIIWALVKHYEIPVPPVVWQIIGFGLLAILAILVIVIVARVAGSA